MYDIDSKAHFRDLLSPGNRFQYLFWRLTKSTKPFRCQIRNGPVLSLRPVPAPDWNTAVEIFLLRIYDAGKDPGVRRIVDLGGNIGYSCLFWCSTYPNAEVLVFEPHPAHCELLDWHVRENRFQDRVHLVRAGAAPRPGTATLTDDEVGSSVVRRSESVASLQVEMVDVFASIGRGPVDILKMDIEGAEYAILEDPRFDELAGRTRRLIMEWHVYEPSHLGPEWCRQRLEKAGFDVQMGPAHGRQYGTLTALRRGAGN